MLAYRRNGKIIIGLDAQNLIVGAENHPDWNAKVTDSERFLDYVTAQLLVVDRPMQEDPMINELLDYIVSKAIESDEGIESAGMEGM